MLIYQPASISMSDGSITLGIPNVSPASKAFLQFPFTSWGESESKSLKVNENYISINLITINSYIKSGRKWWIRAQKAIPFLQLVVKLVTLTPA